MPTTKNPSRKHNILPITRQQTLLQYGGKSSKNQEKSNNKNKENPQPYKSTKNNNPPNEGLTSVCWLVGWVLLISSNYILISGWFTNPEVFLTTRKH